MALRWPSIDPGELRTPVLIQSLLPTSPPTYNSAGEVMTWQTILGGGPPTGYVYAKIAPLHARDVIGGGQNVSEVEIPITMRFHPLIQANCRIVKYIGRQSVYIIKGAANTDERDVLVEWSCVALSQNE
jgi:head-tail adaptor